MAWDRIFESYKSHLNKQRFDTYVIYNVMPGPLKLIEKITSYQCYWANCLTISVTEI